jgi:hypothetical protein
MGAPIPGEHICRRRSSVIALVFKFGFDRWEIHRAFAKFAEDALSHRFKVIPAFTARLFSDSRFAVL